MHALTTSESVNVYLTKAADELVLQQGHNPNRFARADRHILVIGGGVTGMTVSRSHNFPNDRF